MHQPSLGEQGWAGTDTDCSLRASGCPIQEAKQGPFLPPGLSRGVEVAEQVGALGLPLEPQAAWKSNWRAAALCFGLPRKRMPFPQAESEQATGPSSNGQSRVCSNNPLAGHQTHEGEMHERSCLQGPERPDSCASRNMPGLGSAFVGFRGF